MLKKKIIIASNTCWSVVNFRLNLIESLIKDGFDVIIVAEKDNTLNRLKETNIEFINLKFYNRNINPFIDLWTIVKIFLIFIRKKPDLFLGFTIKPNLYCSIICTILNINFINTITGMGDAFKYSKTVTFILHHLIKLFFKKSSCVFLQNKSDKKYFLDNNLVENKKITLVRGSGVDLAHFSNKNTYERIEEIKKNNFNFLFLGRIMWNKGFDDYCFVAKEIKAEYQNVCFNVLGFTSSDKAFVSRDEIEFHHNAGYINYLGSSDDVRPFLNDCDCLIYPTKYSEGVPKSILEAAAMEKVLIATDIKGCRDVIKNNYNGYLYKPNDLEQLKKLIIFVLKLDEKEKKRLQKFSRININKFSHNFVVRSYNKQINKLILK